MKSFISLTIYSLLAVAIAAPTGTPLDEVTTTQLPLSSTQGQTVTPERDTTIVFMTTTRRTETTAAKLSTIGETETTRQEIITTQGNTVTVDGTTAVTTTLKSTTSKHEGHFQTFVKKFISHRDEITDALKTATNDVENAKTHNQKTKVRKELRVIQEKIYDLKNRISNELRDGGNHTETEMQFIKQGQLVVKKFFEKVTELVNKLNH